MSRPHVRSSVVENLAPESGSAPGEQGHSSGAAGRLTAAVWLALLLGIATAIHCLAPAIVDQDTSYHIAVARLMRAHGMLQSFPWTPFSWLADHYVDKELLFHLLMLPFSELPPLWCARIIGSALGFVLLASWYGILRAERVSLPGLWVLLGLLSSSGFVLRFAMVRPHLLSVAASLGFVWLAARKRRVPLLLLGMIYPLCYTAWHLPVILLLLVELSRLVCERRVDRACLPVALAGLLLGIALHPHFPRNLTFFWVQNVQVLQIAWAARDGFDMGGEFRSPGVLDLLRWLLLPLMALGFAAARNLLQLRRGRADVVAMSFFVAAAALSVLTLRSERFTEYQVPFALLAAALAARGLRLNIALPALLAIATACFATFGQRSLRTVLKRGEDFVPADMAALRSVIPPGAQVVTCDWGLTGGLMLGLPERKFVVALDPVFFYVKDPELYRFWFETTHRPPPAPARALRSRMRGDFVVCDARMMWRPLLHALQADPAARLAKVTQFWIAFQLLD